MNLKFDDLPAEKRHDGCEQRSEDEEQDIPVGIGQLSQFRGSGT
jgi:hypothetical protein